MLFEKVNVIMNLVAFVMTLSVAFTLAAHNHCPPNTYYNTTFKKCVNCSTCPDNEIIRSPCSPYEDLSCGPFVEFNRFVVGGKHKQQNKSRVHHPYWKPDPQKPVIHIDPNIDYTKPRMNQPALVTTINQDTTPWKTIALSLISIICTSVVLLLVAVIVVHFYKKRNSGYDKEVIYDTNESGLTEIDNHELIDLSLICYSTARIRWNIQA
ncbi:XP_014771772.1PREDICTED: uncharacterized protein LOC106870268 [Octopus vulgaris]|uniref:XP_014771772.1PREDICTED: uncharacterized protein LOC106870268 n=1 Tax=Octopus vulgaris TaxID=6645 RepID=A0AA36F5Z4_OCTVU|nr:XP_014771772.1PREDICTED: uncharacterized protein LOC106870268 [Octopus vulgaris]